MYNKVSICGVDTSKLPVLREAQNEQLLKRTRAGDNNARDELINGNLRLVLSVIQRFTNRGENLDDLFQVGCIGLIKSIDNFDVTQNVRFSTYAVPMVIECRNPRKDFECYDQKNRITTGNFTTLSGPKEYGDL
ncbi:MAG: sigma-70 family RNA polymerase sigma factor [Clostridia bacterium]|nr:sigma-70 family RNA polymerase sigma factor [Clostridia bacterium]